MDISERSYLDLLEESWHGLKQTILRCEALGFPWEVSKLFTRDVKGKTISHVALLECPVLMEGRWHQVGALHAVCTHRDHRGQGIATELIQESLHWSKERCEAVFLFTEIPAFYQRISFRPVQEHRFHLPGFYHKGSELLRPVSAPQDNELFLRCFRERAPLSDRLWVKDHGVIAAFNAWFATYPNYESVYYSPLIDGFLCYQLENKTFHLLDVVARKIPSLDLILAHLPQTVEDLYVYFPPDQLTDKAIPEPYLYDKGHLLVHGSWEISHPFMVSPLSRC